jgi:hypothetical protein
MVAMAAVLRIWGIGFGLPAVLARPDENVILEVAVDAAAGDLNPRFFTYPTGFIYLLAALFHITVPLFHPPHAIGAAWDFPTLFAIWHEPFYLTGRWAVAVMGILSIPVVYLIGKRVGGRHLGLAAAWFFAVAPIPVRHAHFSVSDYPMAFFCLLSVVFILRRIDGGGLWSSLLAGIFGGVAASMKYPGALMAVPILLVHIGWKPFRIHHHLWWSALAMVGTFVVLNPFVFVEWDLFRAHFAYETAHLLAPHEGIDLGRGWFYHPWVTFPTAVGMPVYLAAIGGLVWWVIRGGIKRWIMVITPLVFLVFLGRGKAVFFRYMDAVFPFLVILAAGFLVEVTGRLPWKQSARTVTLAVVAVLLSVAPLSRSVAIDRLLSREDTRVQAAEWLHQHLEPGTKVFLSGYFGMPPIVPHFFKYLRITDEREDRLFEKYQEVVSRAPEWDRYPLEVVQPEDIFPNLADVTLSEKLWRDSLRTWGVNWVVVDRYFLPFYSDVPAELPKALRADFDKVVTFSCLESGAKPMPLFELQDAFYLPVAQFHGIQRPGPELIIYGRKGIE